MSPRSLESSSVVRAMSDAGLKPVIVYHNLTPAELYEVRRALACGPLFDVWAVRSRQRALPP